MRHFSTRFFSALTAGALALTAGLVTTSAHAAGIIKNPGDHPDYAVELEPHLALGWGGHHYWGDAGYGLGMHAVIPFLDNGPVDTINNNMGIGFGLNWIHYETDCGWYRGNLAWAGCGWSGNSFQVPVFVQWNFFFTKVVSVFAEGGLGIYHETISADNCPSNFYCSDSHTGVFGVGAGGGRFLFGDKIGLSVRLGYPNLTVGMSILL